MPVRDLRVGAREHDAHVVARLPLREGGPIMMLMGTLYYLEGELAGLEQILRGEGLLIVYGAVLVLGIVLAVLAAWFAVNRYMYMAVGKMYYI